MASKLVSLPAIERLSPRVIRILGGNPGKFTLQGTNTYLLGTESERILIDTGEGHSSWFSSVQEILTTEKVTILQILITHRHHDHIGGIPAILPLFPNCSVHKFPPSLSSDRSITPITNNQTFTVPGATLRAIHTPGHTEDHVCFHLEEEDALFTGDNVLGQGTPVFEDLNTYVSSLNLMKTLFKGRAYPGHGPVIEDGKARVDEYMRHRQKRELEVLTVLDDLYPENEGMGVTAMDIVKVVYKEYPANLHTAAERGVRQILDKLESEGKVVKGNAERWRVKVWHAASL